MIIECPQCKAKYEISEERVKGKNKLKCSRCQTVFEIMEAKGDSSGKKDTAKILQQKVEDSLWINENLKLPDDRKLSLAVIKGARAGFIFHLNKPYVLIGRGKVDLIIPDKEVSRKHLAIEVRNEKVFLRDLGSTNGTFISDDKVSITEITDQTEFKIGQTTLMLIITSQGYEK